MEEGKEFSNVNGMEFIETSAKTADKVTEAFELLGREIMNLNGKKRVKSSKRNLSLDQGNVIDTKQQKKRKFC